MNRTTLLIPAAVLVIATILSSMYIVDERQKVLVLQFGQIKQVREEPGLYFKVPVIQEIVRYEDRILGFDIDPQEVTPRDDRRLVVDAFARWRIVDVQRFRQAVGSGGEALAQDRLGGILINEIRNILGQVDSSVILSADRTSITKQILDSARTKGLELGVQIVDVRLRRTDLPEQNLQATFARMRAEREREATDQIARGNEAAQRLRAQADRTVIETVSDAKRQAEIVRGEADAKRNAIFATAYGADPDFFQFYRSLTAYRDSLQAGNSTLVLSPDSEFFRYLKDSKGSAPAADPAPAP
jgi:membrane protease subunit HflC